MRVISKEGRERKSLISITLNQTAHNKIGYGKCGVALSQTDTLEFSQHNKENEDRGKDGKKMQPRRRDTGKKWNLRIEKSIMEAKSGIRVSIKKRSGEKINASCEAPSNYLIRMEQ